MIAFETYLGGLIRGTRVSDLTPPKPRECELAFVFESPHTSELRRGYPLAGGSGRDALDYLSSGRAAGMSLGELVRRRHDDGDSRIAILNTSDVPLQRRAFSRAERPDVESWQSLEAARVSKAAGRRVQFGTDARRVDLAISSSIEARLGELVANPDVRFVLAGRFAQRIVRSVPSVDPARLVEVYHPSYRWWQRAAGDEASKLAMVADLFRALS